jgi:hypothetical protein
MRAHVLTSRVVQAIFGVEDIGQVVKILPGTSSGGSHYGASVAAEPSMTLRCPVL